MKDFKKMPKMKCGGGVRKYADGGDVNLDTIVRKSAGLPLSRNTAATPSAPVKPYTGPTPNINEVVRRSTGEPNYVEPKVVVPKTAATKYTGPDVDINDIVKSRLKKGGKVKRGKISK